MCIRDSYYDREDVCVENAIPTAEGAAAVAISELPVTLHGSNVAVLGFGRVARQINHNLCLCVQRGNRKISNYLVHFDVAAK